VLSIFVSSGRRGSFFVTALAVLTASHLTRRFGDRVAVEDLSFSLAPGEIFGLLGPNGGGKTTTLRMLAGLIAPTDGHVELDGQPVTRATSASLRQRIGFLTEAPGLWDGFTVRQNLTVYARLHELDDTRRAVDRAMDVVDIADRAGDAAAQLSKGLKQRVALARALIHDPPIVLLDEPTSGLDPESARGVRELILRMRDEKRSVLLSTHNLDEVERIADRIAVLRSRLLALDTPAALRRQLFSTRTRFVLSNAAERFAALLREAGAQDVAVEDRTLVASLDGTGVTVPRLVARLVEAGAGIEQVTADEPPLEEIYLKLVRGRGTERR
jgi:ABC-2 type transport system ATP-binding protein